MVFFNGWQNMNTRTLVTTAVHFSFSPAHGHRQEGNPGRELFRTPGDPAARSAPAVRAGACYPVENIEGTCLIFPRAGVAVVFVVIVVIVAVVAAETVVVSASIATDGVAKGTGSYCLCCLAWVHDAITSRVRCIHVRCHMDRAAFRSQRRARRTIATG